MATKTFCDICKKEITERREKIEIWSWPSNYYCIKCWNNEKKWPKIHKLAVEKKRR